MPADAPASVRGDYPDWLEPSFARAFGAAAAEEGAALARRAPVDLRVNTLKADREKVLKALGRFAPQPDAAVADRRARCRRPTGRAGSPTSRPRSGTARGWYEVQDEGSQIAALMAGAGPREQVLDICAGAGGKTLALAAAMRNTGQIYAYDDDAQRLRPIFERLKRAGVRNAQVLQAGDEAALDGARRPLRPRVRRRPLHRHGRLAPAARCQVAAEARQPAAARAGAGAVLATARRAGQARRPPRLRHLLGAAAGERRPGRGFPREPSRLRDVTVARRRGAPASAASRRPRPTAATATLLLTPARHGTDGFFIAVLGEK